MKIPQPIPCVDVEAAREALLAGMTAAEFARRHGHRPEAVRRALRRKGIAIPKPEPLVRDATDHKLRAIWGLIRTRCEDPSSSQYRHFGARGLRLCAQWSDFRAFRDWSRANGYAIGKCITLKSRGVGFSPYNCAWTNRSEAITRGVLAGDGSSWGIKAFGETKTARAWESDPRCKVGGETLRVRVRRGVPAEFAITLPPNADISSYVAITRSAARGFKQNRAPHRLIDWKQVRRLYVDEGRSVPEVARELRASYHGVLRGLERRGWLRDRKPPIASLKHGRRLYKAWCSMRERCASVRHPDYGRIGRTGIKIDGSWEEFSGFYEWALASGYRPGLVLTRRDRRRDYAPDNCVWLSRSEANQYQRPTKVSKRPRWTITAFGETKGPVAWTRDSRCTVTFTGLVHRLRLGMTPEHAISEPNRHPDSGNEGDLIRAFGTSKSVSAWARDRRARVGVSSLRARIQRGVDPELAITAPPYTLEPAPANGRRGVRRKGRDRR